MTSNFHHQKLLPTPLGSHQHLLLQDAHPDDKNGKNETWNTIHNRELSYDSNETWTSKKEENIYAHV